MNHTDVSDADYASNSHPVAHQPIPGNTPSQTTAPSSQRSSLPTRIWHAIKSKTPYLIAITLLMTLVILFLWNRIVITIHSGNGGVLFHRFSGTEIDTVYTEGLYLISPFNKMYIYETRKQLKLHEFNILTLNGLRVNLSLAIRYQPVYDMLGILHKEIGPDYVQRVIVSQIESVMRKRLGQYTAEHIYTNEQGLLTETILLAMKEVGYNYVDVRDIIIRSIELPQKVKTAIENKIKEEELLKTYRFRLQIAKREAERKRIEAEGIKVYQEIIDQSLSERILTHQGIKATQELAASSNAKIVVIGAGDNGLPIILGGQGFQPQQPQSTQTPSDKPSR